jgi:uncharacterized protein YkwD
VAPPNLAKPLVASLLAVLALAPAASGASLQRARAVVRPAARTATAAVPQGGLLIAPISACPNQEGLSDPSAVQEEAMRCMTDYAREQAGLPGVSESTALDESARAKGEDVIACDSFSHTACGHEFTYWFDRAGYLSAPCWRAGEILAWGTGEYGTVRSIFRAWMASPEHRHVILGSFTQLGLSVGVGELEGRPDARVWTGHFGAHCEVTAAS